MTHLDLPQGISITDLLFMLPDYVMFNPTEPNAFVKYFRILNIPSPNGYIRNIALVANESGCDVDEAIPLGEINTKEQFYAKIDELCAIYGTINGSATSCSYRLTHKPGYMRG